MSSCSAASCVLTLPGAVISIRRAPVDPHQIADVMRAVATASDRGSRKIVMLVGYRLSPDFPVDVRHMSAPEGWAPAVRELDRVVTGLAMIIEFGGVRAMGLRAISRVIWGIARPRAALGTFDRVSDGAEWLAPYAEAIGAQPDPSEYVRAYRMADRMLDDVDDARRATR